MPKATPGELIADLGNGLRIERWAIADLREQETNAQVMSPTKFKRLVDNIRRRGALESTPFVSGAPIEDGQPMTPPEIVSGHHRIRAARAAGLIRVDLLVDRSGLSRSAIVAKQLAHNALVGEEDESLQRRLLEMIDSADDLLETGLDEDLIQRLQSPPDDVRLFAPHADFQWQTISLVFLPHQLEEFKQLLDAVNGRQDLLGAVPDEQFRPFLQAASAYARFKDVRNAGTVVALLTRTALEQLSQAVAKEPAHV
jgi:hypothetical protein